MKSKKGLSLIEIIVSIALIATITVFMYQLLSDVTFQKNNEYFASLNQETKVEILDYLKEKYEYTNIDSSTCVLKNACDFRLHGEEVLRISLTKSDNKWYLALSKDEEILKKWYLVQVNGGKIKVEKLNEFFLVNVELYTNNTDNTENNNNTLDDIVFSMRNVKYSSTSSSPGSGLYNAFASVQCVRQKSTNNDGEGGKPSGYDFTNGIAGDCIFASGNTGTKTVLKFVTFPVRPIIQDENEYVDQHGVARGKTLFVHFCRMRSYAFDFEQYSALGDYPNDTSIDSRGDGSFYWRRWDGVNPVTGYGSLNGNPPCRSRYSSEISHINGYAVEFVIHYPGVNDNNAVNNDRRLHFDCMDFVNNLNENNNDVYIYGEELKYTYNTDGSIKSKVLVKSCTNKECLKENGEVNLGWKK